MTLIAVHAAGPRRSARAAARGGCENPAPRSAGV